MPDNEIPGETYREWVARMRAITPKGESIVVPDRFILRGEPAPPHTIDLAAVQLALDLFGRDL